MAKSYGKKGLNQFDGIIYEEFISDLRGSHGIEIFKEMEFDDVCGSILYAIDIMCRQVDWNVNPSGDTEDDKKAAEFIYDCLYDMEDTFSDTISEILTFLAYGWSYLEINYKRRNGRKSNSKYNDGLIGWSGWETRAQETLVKWELDERENVIGLTQNVDGVNYTIPRDKALHFKTKNRKGNPEGLSIFRNAYKSWYFKKRFQELEGIGIERDLAGLPMIIAPEDTDIWNDEDTVASGYRKYAELLVQNVRRDATEGAVIPYGWDFKLLSSAGSRQINISETIERYDKRIAMSVLADFIMLGHDGVGSYSMANSKIDMFYKSLKTYLDKIAEEINNKAIPQLIELNHEHFKGITDYPEITHGEITSSNPEEIAKFIEILVKVGALQVDEQLEDYLRSVGKLPERVETNHGDMPNIKEISDEEQKQIEVGVEKIFEDVKKETFLNKIGKAIGMIKDE